MTIIIMAATVTPKPEFPSLGCRGHRAVTRAVTAGHVTPLPLAGDAGGAQGVAVTRLRTEQLLPP